MEKGVMENYKIADQITTSEECTRGYEDMSCFIPDKTWGRCEPDTGEGEKINRAQDVIT